MKTLKNKTALVTGASRSIGRGVTLALSEAGVQVAVNYYQSNVQYRWWILSFILGKSIIPLMGCPIVDHEL